VMHAEHVANVLESMTGERVGVVTGETFAMERQQILSDFRRGQLRWCVNVDVLTTGFDAPAIDAIAVLRATMSPGLFAQIVGRGLRKADGKQDCLVLDFGENIKRHGSLDDPSYGRASPSGNGSTAVENNGRGKKCPSCEIEVPARTAVCPECGHWFPPGHDIKADDKSTLIGEHPPERWQVVACAWARHTKRKDPDAPPTLRVDYECQPDDGQVGNLSGKHVSEWVCIEHSGFAWTKAAKWWQERSVAEMPTTVDEAIELLNRGVCRMPSFITTKREGKYLRVVKYEFLDDIPDESEWLPEQDNREPVEYSGFDDSVPF